MSYLEAAILVERQAIALVPIGATEAHGPHLPLGTDALISEELSRRVHAELAAAGQASVIAPSLAYAVTEFGAEFTGTVSLNPATATALYVGVCCGLIRAGFNRVCLINSHLETAHVTALLEACAEVERLTNEIVAFPNHTEPRWARTLSDDFKRGDCHAGRYETALAMAAFPELVRGEVQQSLPQNPADFLGAVRAGAASFRAAGGQRAYFGDPAAASRDEGEELYHRLVHIVLTTIAETWDVTVPLHRLNRPSP